MNKISAHLNWKELACKDGTPFPIKWEDRAKRLADLFEDIRSLSGNNPIQIYSAYRTVFHNKKIKGATNSQHLYGRALDLHHTELSPSEFYEIIRSNVAILRIKGLGRYKTFTHVDIRPTDNLVVWTGSGLKDSVNV